MLILVDTNLLLRLVEPAHSQHAIAIEATRILRKSGHRLAILPQIVYEFWAVATRPLDVNGLGMSAAQTALTLDELMPSFKLLLDERAIFEIWQQLVIDYEVEGKQVHDARLVAGMLRHDISHLLTFNAHHFARYSTIRIVEPEHADALEPAI